MNHYKFNVGDYVKIKNDGQKNILYRNLLLELKPKSINKNLIYKIVNGVFKITNVILGKFPTICYNVVPINEVYSKYVTVRDFELSDGRKFSNRYVFSERVLEKYNTSFLKQWRDYARTNN